ncbi:hypothetical protein AVEN_38244-1 [Araneus ventricosus]|uniref:Uncharacterized protein n=1 Tax=Araneus ventricosus TaxID=182803 RepID=A0A4Y2U5J6_ARAVE|nr:hypothetical protein AVEN_38244-1 [Araneus ventricosus]
MNILLREKEDKIHALESNIGNQNEINHSFLNLKRKANFGLVGHSRGHFCLSVPITKRIDGETKVFQAESLELKEAIYWASVQEGRAKLLCDSESVLKENILLQRYKVVSLRC